MKKLLFILCALMLCVSTAEARPHGGPGHHGGPAFHYAPKHHHHGGNVAAGLAIGIIGGSILNAVFSQPRVVTTTAYSPVVTSPALVSAPTVVGTTTVATSSSPCYTTSNIVTGATTTHCSSTVITSNPVTSQVWFSN